MKKLLIATTLTLASIATVHAQTSNTQWRPASTTFATLVQSGYKVVAVTNGTYYLQRDASVMTCSEPQHTMDSKRMDGANPFGCAELVEPYDSTAPQQK